MMTGFMKNRALIILILLPLILVVSCTEKNPPREEIPVIKDLLGRFETAVRDKNAALIDSLMIAEAYDLGYNSTQILSVVYPDPDTSRFLKFGNREFFYTEEVGKVSCIIIADTADPGRPVEITLVKAYNQWYIKRFELKDTIDTK